MEEENWDTDVDSTKVHIPDEVFSKICTTVKKPAYDRGKDWGGGGRRGDGGRGGDGRGRRFGGEDRHHNSADNYGGGGGERRYNDDDNGGNVTMQVEYNKRGSIIGRGGEKIREIQEKFNVKVNVGECRMI